LILLYDAIIEIDPATKQVLMIQWGSLTIKIV
jgi:hypothetical protein